MTKEQLATLLNGREMGNEITKLEEAEAKVSGLVVVFGYSDDNTEFRGAIEDELDCYGGKTLTVTRDGVLHAWADGEEKDKVDALDWFRLNQLPKADVKAVWGKSGFSWTFETAIPHATFEVMDLGEKFCRGVIFSINDLPR